MKKKIISVILALILVLSFSGTVFAQPGEGSHGAKQSLVALGNSITTGYGLERNLLRVSKNAYPQLLGDEMGYRVNNLAVSGWTSQDLLDTLQNKNRYRIAIKHADLITLNIGGNDVLGYLMEVDFEDPDLDPYDILEEVIERLIAYYYNLGFILQEIREINPEAPILYYGFYNPIDAAHPFSIAFGYDNFNELIWEINNTILYVYDEVNLPNPVGECYAEAFDYLYYVDALTAFETYVSTEGDKADLFVDEVHPSELGQELLYQAALAVLVEEDLLCGGYLQIAVSN